VFLAGVFAPALVAVLLTARAAGRAGVAQLLAPIGRWQVPGWYYAFAVLYFPATKLAAALVVRIGTGTWPRFGDTPILLMLGGLFVSTWVQAGEEVGWRGYALPRLAARLGLGGASLVLGMAWALWHLPLFFIAGSGSDGQSFPVYLLHVTALSVAMAWLYWRTGGSLLLTMLMHAAINNTTTLVPAASPVPVGTFAWDTTPMAWATAAVAWVVAGALLVRMRRSTASRLRDADPVA
jgi:membrane protease YdiL (CAAX protease family)